MKIRLAFVMALTTLAGAIACSSESAAPDDLAAAGASARPVKTVTPAVLARGHEIYKANCVPCHGVSGKGDGPGAGVLKPPPRDHTDYAYMSTLSDKEIADVIKMGGAIKGRPLMPSHPQIGGSDMDALVAFIRTLSVPK
jgi:mono/diheme cytochrome c family protein